LLASRVVQAASSRFAPLSSRSGDLSAGETRTGTSSRFTSRTFDANSRVSNARSRFRRSEASATDSQQANRATDHTLSRANWSYAQQKYSLSGEGTPFIRACGLSLTLSKCCTVALPSGYLNTTAASRLSPKLCCTSRVAGYSSDYRTLSQTRALASKRTLDESPDRCGSSGLRKRVIGGLSGRRQLISISSECL